MKKKHESEVPRQPKKEGKEFRGIVRIAGVDLKGELRLKRAMTKIKGVGIRSSDILSEIISKDLSIPETIVVGELNDEQVRKIEYILSNLVKFGVPPYMVNRQKDPEAGENRHLTGTDLVFTTKKDIEQVKNINSWKGYRHMYGQKVRGQRTRTTGRQGMSVGVVRKTLMKKTAPGKGAKKEEKT